MYVRKPAETKQQKPNLNECYYSPVQPNTLQMKDSTIGMTSPHEYCSHSHYCIFNNNRITLEQEITTLEKELNEFKMVKEEAINGNIIYRPEFDNHYTITKSYYTGLDGKEKVKLGVTVSDNFVNAVNTKITNLKYDLENLLRFRRDVIHGKIGGYGNA